VDGFSIAYDRYGAGSAVVLLHGWPATRVDYGAVLARLRDEADLVVPDLRGFGQSELPASQPPAAYAAPAQAASVRGLIDELGLDRPVLVGYGVGSRVAQTVAQLSLCEELVGAAPAAVRAYLSHLWSHWSGVAS